MVENRGQGECRGTASKDKGRHQEVVERPTGERTFHGSKAPAPTSSPQLTAWEKQVLAILHPEGRHQEVVQQPTGERTFHGSKAPDPTSSPQLTAWEEQVLAILHPEGLTGVVGGLDPGAPANPSGEEVPRLSSTPTEDAPSDDSNSGLLDLDILPGPSGTTGQSAHSQAATEPPPSEQGDRDTRRTTVCQGEDRTREPTVQEALTNVLGAYQQSQDKMSQILNNMQENQRLQEIHHQETRKDLQALNTTMVSIAGVLADMANIIKQYTAHQRAPSTSQSTEQPTTSAAASGQEALPQDPQATSTPSPAEGGPLRKHSLRPRQMPETLAKTKTTTRA
ncbi:hypothetical protein NDU88_001217 [Pleurodeles waltl]|uniref:Uncharacterized protein n=1 Tax=Pleurodeles waltl TaxID=8319 RepID=A0AAV7P640_PLEWA|nr:hypothetical protein NDU88_001217 [Pleurodeles waltl]